MPLKSRGERSPFGRPLRVYKPDHVLLVGAVSVDMRFLKLCCASVRMLLESIWDMIWEWIVCSRSLQRTEVREMVR